MRRLLALATALVAAGSLAASASAGNHFTDPTGDSTTAPDITSVDVSNDASGTVTFLVTMVTRPAFAPDENVDIFIDSDMNPATGSSSGSEYVLALASDGWELAHWSGSAFAQVTTHGPITVTPALGTPSFTVKWTINKADFGNVGAFNFWVLASKGPGAATDPIDVAPDGTAVYSYTLAAPPTVASIVIGFKPAAAVRGVHPGARFSIGSAGVKLSDGSLADPDSVKCKASVRGKPIPASGLCSWKVPKSAAGKTIVVVVNVVYQGKTYSAPFTVKVLKK